MHDVIGLTGRRVHRASRSRSASASDVGVGELIGGEVPIGSLRIVSAGLPRFQASRMGLTKLRQNLSTSTKKNKDLRAFVLKPAYTKLRRPLL